MSNNTKTGIISLYSDVKATPIKWLWYPFFAIGKISLLQGDPGDGKSTMMLRLIADQMEGSHRMVRHLVDRSVFFISVLKMVLLIRSNRG